MNFNLGSVVVISDVKKFVSTTICQLFHDHSIPVPIGIKKVDDHPYSLNRFQMTSGGSSNGRIVKLNVGGFKYTTTESTLNSKGMVITRIVLTHLIGENFFTTLLQNDREGKVPCLRDEEGFIFIDRNGKAFHVILEYLRTGHMFNTNDEVSKEQLEIEFDFYQISIPLGWLTPSKSVAWKLYSDLGPDSDTWQDIMENFWTNNWNKMFDEIKKAVKAGNTEITFYLVYSDKFTNVYSNQYLLLPEKCKEKRIVRDILKHLFRQQGYEVSTDYHMTYMRVLWNLESQKTGSILRTLVTDSGHGYYYLNTHNQ